MFQKKQLCSYRIEKKKSLSIVIPKVPIPMRNIRETDTGAYFPTEI